MFDAARRPAVQAVFWSHALSLRDELSPCRRSASRRLTAECELARQNAKFFRCRFNRLTGKFGCRLNRLTGRPVELTPIAKANHAPQLLSIRRYHPHCLREPFVRGAVDPDGRAAGRLEGLFFDQVPRLA